MGLARRSHQRPDLNADRFDDVAVGVPNESWRAKPGHREWLGRVVVVPGGANGVVAARSWAFTQDSRGVPDRTEEFDQFGFSLLVDDVTGDGWDELIVWGNEGDRLDGALFVLPGPLSKIRARGATVFYGRTAGLPALGVTLVAGNFDRRGPDDVIVSSGPHDGMGAVTMLRGTPSGLTATGSRTIRRHSPGMPRLFEGWEAFGESLAAGDVDGDGDDDLLVSSSAEAVSGFGTAGRVFVIQGRGGGITTEGVQPFSADSPGVPGSAHGGGGFGLCVGLFDSDGDGRTQAVIRHERIDGTFAATANLTILPTTSSGLTGRGAHILEPSDFGADPRTEGYTFGCGLAG
jgi:FG-GAP repeat